MLDVAPPSRTSKTTPVVRLLYMVSRDSHLKPALTVAHRPSSPPLVIRLKRR